MFKFLKHVSILQNNSRRSHTKPETTVVFGEGPRRLQDWASRETFFEYDVGTCIVCFITENKKPSSYTVPQQESMHDDSPS